MKNVINAEYGTERSGGLLDRILAAQRRRMFDAFKLFRQSAPVGTVLNLYMKPTALFGNSDYLVTWSDLRDRSSITSHPVEPLSSQPAGDIRLPFAESEFDWVFCNEVIEHAGSVERQFTLVHELYRVARKGVFLTTANRRHPIEFKTGMPLIHLLPANWWRRLLKLIGKGKWASESVLNPVDAAALYRFASLLPGAPEHDVGHKRVFGIKAHFFLMILKDRARIASGNA